MAVPAAQRLSPSSAALRLFECAAALRVRGRSSAIARRAPPPGMGLGGTEVPTMTTETRLASARR